MNEWCPGYQAGKIKRRNQLIVPTIADRMSRTTMVGCMGSFQTVLVLLPRKVWWNDGSKASCFVYSIEKGSTGMGDKHGIHYL